MPTHPTEWYDRQYNNRALIPDHPAILQGWADRSAATRDRLRDASRIDLPYTERGRTDPSERLDVFLPRRNAASPAPVVDTTAPSPVLDMTAPSPVLVHIHGGYWRALDKSDHSFVAEPFVNAGAVVVVPNYALCPAVTIETIVMQMVHAVAWTWRHAHEFDGDPMRIVVAGHSAGGHLAAMLLRCLWQSVAPDLPAGLVARAMSISGLFDLEPVRHASFLAADLRLTEASALKLSPAKMPAPEGVLYAWAGADETDEFRRQNRLIAQQWGERVVPVCEEVAARHHLDILDDLVDPSHRLHRSTLELLDLA